MKRLFLFLYFASALLTTGCTIFSDDSRDDITWDWYPVNLYITVENKNGVDLLDPTLENNYAIGTTLTFEGKEYGIQTEPNATSTLPGTKAYLAKLKGLTLEKGTIQTPGGEMKDFYYLYFGEIDGALDFDDDLVVKWPDGTQDVIHYYCSDHVVEKLKNGTWNIECKRYWLLNNQPATNTINFVK